MTKNNPKALSEIVRISHQYQRSIRVDADIGRSDALDGYICHSTATAVIGSMCRQLIETNQSCFTWTGPFGGGKSSLAVALASALHLDKTLRAKARQALGINERTNFDDAFPVHKGWLIVPTVGRRGSVVGSLHAALDKAIGKPAVGRGNPNTQTLINELLEEAKNRPKDGVLVLIDEMGKFLEASALGSGDDVYFFQELAEAAARSSGRLVVVGVLHQSFAQYSARLGIDTRDDWAKIQGRYLDIPFVAASDEVVELIGRAIVADEQPEWMSDASEKVAAAIRLSRPAVGQSFGAALSLCWPLHPAMAALLGPISKRQFGQNERSTFGFLSSVEPYGFRSYLNSTYCEEGTWYRPNDYWDYLRSNLEPAILASADGHRWSQAVEAVERAEAKTGDALLVSLIKNIAVIDLFRNGSGLAADRAVLHSIFYTREHEIDAALQKLANLKVALFKSYTGSWSIFEGSDFDIDAAIKDALATAPGIDYARLSHLIGLHPVVAKRHYHETGSMRWMNLSLCSLEQAEKSGDNFSPKKGEFGAFILALPPKGMKPRDARKKAQAFSRLRPWPVMIGIPDNHVRIAELSAELVALEQVKDRHELSGDAVARREVYARLAATRADLEDQLQAAVSLAKWHDGSDQVVEPGSKLSPVASRLADELFTDPPPVWSELVNRDNISSNSVKARRDLLHAMISNESREALGFEGFPAERGLYETLLKSTGLHQRGSSGAWGFSQPTDNIGTGLKVLWDKTCELFSDTNERVGAHDIYTLWGAPPFGMKEGIRPVILTSFILAHKANVAVYKDGMFVPRLTAFDIDECLQDPDRFSMRWVAIDEDKNLILEGISNILAEIGETADASDPLEAARGLVAMVFNMPEWARRTQRIGDTAKAIRDMLLKASDPHKVLFVDLASLLGAADGNAYVNALRAPLKELASAYRVMLSQIEEKMLDALDAERDDLEMLRARASLVSGLSGDLRLDAFATRLANFDGSKAALEGIFSLAVEKPPRDWVDRHIDVAILELTKFARRFREAEAYVSVKGRQPNSEAIAVVIGAGSDTKLMSHSFAIPERHRRTVDAKVNEVATMLDGHNFSTDIMLAILAKVGMRLVAPNKDNTND